jgi:hypothetical protein
MLRNCRAHHKMIRGNSQFKGQDAQRRAKQAGRGIWSGSFTAPWTYGDRMKAGGKRIGICRAALLRKPTRSTYSILAYPPSANCPSGYFVARLRACVVGQIKTMLVAVPCSSQEGRFANRHERWARDAVDAAGLQHAVAGGRTILRRTVKPCGPDTPTLVSSLR